MLLNQIVCRLCSTKGNKNHRLSEIFKLSVPSIPSVELELSVESILDGDSGCAYEHLLNLLYQELSVINDEKLPKSYLRFCNINSSEGYDAIMDDIRNGKITLSNPFNFNDPMDPLLKVWLEVEKRNESNINRRVLKMAKNALKNLRVCCLSDCDNREDSLPLMWSHYAGGHSGIAIKYIISENNLKQHNDDNSVLKICPVRYQKKKHLNGDLSIDNAVLVKGNSWKYESEHRLLYFNKNTTRPEDYLHLDGFEIEAIFLGTKICNQKESEIKRIAEMRNISVYKMSYNMDDLTELAPIKQ